MPVRRSKAGDKLEQEQPVFKSILCSLYLTPECFCGVLYSGPVVGCSYCSHDRRPQQCPQTPDPNFKRTTSPIGQLSRTCFLNFLLGNLQPGLSFTFIFKRVCEAHVSVCMFVCTSMSLGPSGCKTNQSSLELEFQAFVTMRCRCGQWESDSDPP